MPQTRLIGECVICCQTKENERNGRITLKALCKAKKSNTFQTLNHQLALNDIVCNSCYCKVIENSYQNYKKSLENTESVDVNIYQTLIQKINSVEQLELELDELKIQLKVQQDSLGNYILNQISFLNKFLFIIGIYFY